MNSNVFLLAAAASATNGPVPVDAAFANMREHAATQCSFTRTMQEDDENTVEVFDPGTASWKLLEIDGETPGTRALKKYAKKEKSRAGRTLPYVLELDDLANPEGYRLVDDTNLVSVYEFVPTPDPDDDETITDAIVGKLVIDKHSNSVARFEVTNIEPFSPATGITIKHMSQKVEYEWLEDQRTFVIRGVVAKVAGKAFGLKKIAQDMKVTFSDFDCS